MIKNKKLFYSILIIGVLVILGIGLFLADRFILVTEEMIPEEERGYYGFSTFGQCEVDNDCFASGCNAEICQSRFEETMASICILPDRPIPQQLGYGCRCFRNQCQWAK